MSLIHDLTGMKFGRLQVVSYNPGTRRIPAKWECRCDCGRTVFVTGGNLRSGNTTSCGCLKSELVTSHNLKHGGSETKLYQVWHAIKMRCTNPGNKRFKDYGGRGIQLYPLWQDDFSAFYEYILTALGPKPSSSHSIDRINNDGNYEPGNIRWASTFQQGSNTRRIHHLTFHGQTKSIADWSRLTGINRSTIRERIERLGWFVERALTTPPQKGNK